MQTRLRCKQIPPLPTPIGCRRFGGISLGTAPCTLGGSDDWGGLRPTELMTNPCANRRSGTLSWAHDPDPLPHPDRQSGPLRARGWSPASQAPRTPPAPARPRCALSPTLPALHTAAPSRRQQLTYSSRQTAPSPAPSASSGKARQQPAADTPGIRQLQCPIAEEPGADGPRPPGGGA